MVTALTSLEIRELMPLGTGGMGTAYLACTKAGHFERLVVLKRLHEHLVDDPDARQRLLAEAELAAYVHHANVVGVQHVGKDERGLFIVLDYIEGTSLNHLILAQSPLCIPEPIALRIALDCLAGLSAIHTTTDNRRQPLNILHRDVTPDNVLLGLDGLARLSDFGIAKSSRSTVQTGPLQLIGKLPYMAPEYVDRGQIGPAMDVYAMGVTLWQLLVGRLPWEAQEQAQYLVKILIDGVPPLPEEGNYSPELRAIVAKACALDPTQRYQTAREMAEALEGLRATHQIAEHSQVAAYVTDAAGHEAEFRREEASMRLALASLEPSVNGPLSDRAIPSIPSLPSLAALGRVSEFPKVPAVSEFGRASEFPRMPALPDFARSAEISKQRPAQVAGDRPAPQVPGAPLLPDFTRASRLPTVRIREAEPEPKTLSSASLVPTPHAWTTADEVRESDERLESAIRPTLPATPRTKSRAKLYIWGAVSLIIGFGATHRTRGFGIFELSASHAASLATAELTESPTPLELASSELSAPDIAPARGPEEPLPVTAIALAEEPSASPPPPAEPSVRVPSEATAAQRSTAQLRPTSASRSPTVTVSAQKPGPEKLKAAPLGLVTQNPYKSGSAPENQALTTAPKR